MNGCRYWWVALWLLFIGHSGLAASGESKPALRILFPKPGIVVNSGTLIEATITPEPTRDQFAAVRFSFSQDRKEFRAITGPAPDGSAPYGVLWNTQSLSGGRYYVRAEAIPRDSGVKPLVEIIALQVNEQPTAVARVKAAPDGKYAVLFDAAKSKAAGGGRIRSYHWDFEDGTSADGVTVTHSYAGPGRHPFQLAVTDARGGKGTTDHILDLVTGRDNGAVQIEDKTKDGCGCKQMRILDGDKATSRTTVVGPEGFKLKGAAADAMPEAERTKLGGYDGGAENHKLDLTKGPFTIKTRFEVVADLREESEPALCAEGQRVKRSNMLGAKSEDKNDTFSSDPRYDSSKGADPYAPAPAAGSAPPATKGACGYSGDKWCDDDYHGGEKVTGQGKAGGAPPNGNKKYDGEKRIVWLDAPGPIGLSAETIKAGGFVHDAKFEALVTGSNGSCKCSWEVHIAIDKAGEIRDNKVSSIDCSP